MSATDILHKLIDISYWWKSRQNPSKLRNGEVDSKPGDMLKKLSEKEREELSNLKSENIDSQLRVEKYYMMNQSYDCKQELLEFEKSIGIKPLPRKKYED